MLEISNIKVYDLEESIIACRNAMRLDPPVYTEEEFDKSLERAKILAKSPNGSGHMNFLKGIRVSFDLKYTQYITKQLQRYGFFDYVSSSSMMHRIHKMDFSKCVNKYVSKATINEVEKWKKLYNYIVDNHVESWTFYDVSDNPIETTNYQDTCYTAYMILLSNCPMGTELFVRVSTNYMQIRTIYAQRKGHKLKEDYGAFCDFVRSLPYAKEFITGE